MINNQIIGAMIAGGAVSSALQPLNGETLALYHRYTFLTISLFFIFFVSFSLSFSSSFFLCLLIAINRYRAWKRTIKRLDLPSNVIDQIESFCNDDPLSPFHVSF